LNWREHHRLVLVGLGLAAVALVFLVARGCGCGQSRATADKPSAAAKDTAKTAAGKTASGKPKKVWADDCPEPPNWGKEDETPKPQPAAPPAAAPRVSPPPDDDNEGVLPPRGAVVAAPRGKKLLRSNDVADWRRDDYYSAKREGDLKLAAAVTWLGEHYAGKDAACELLIRLLESGVDDPFAEAAPQRPPNAKVTEALVAALAANGTPRARQTLERLVAGTMKTADNQTAAAAALTVLLKRPGHEKEDEELLFGVVTLPADTAAMDAAMIDSDKLRVTAFGLVESSASEALRIRLARYAVRPETPPALCDRLWACLKAPRTENLAAQTIFYESGRLDEKTKDSLDQQFAAQSAASLGWFLDIAPPKAPPAARGAIVATINPCRVAEVLWNGPFAIALQRQLKTIDGLHHGAGVVRLVCTIPSQPMRSALLQALEKRWEEGPQGLATLSSPEDVLQDPGFLLVIKKLPRKDAAPAGDAAKAKTANPKLASVKVTKIAAQREATEQQDKRAAAWMAFSESLVRATCQRFCAEAQARSAVGRSEQDLMPSNMPLKPHPHAEIVASYQMDWPERLDGKFDGPSLSPLRVSYVRIEQKARPTSLLAYYRRELPTCGEHGNPFGVWLDAFTVDKERRAVQSIDVLITKLNKDDPMILRQEQEVVVEILTIEIENAPREESPSRGEAVKEVGTRSEQVGSHGGHTISHEVPVPIFSKPRNVPNTERTTTVDD
jgi:hypothetical protein